MHDLDICIPAYNDGRYIADVLSNLLDQSFKNFRIFIIDDASEDNTFEIAEEFSKKDERICLYKNDVNIGLVRNFNRAFSLGNAQFLMLKSSNDTFPTDYIEKLMRRHMTEVGAGLVYAPTQYIDENSQLIDGPPVPETAYFQTWSMTPLQSAETVMKYYYTASPLWGIFRRSVVSRALPYPDCHGGDHVLLCNAAIHGHIVCVPDTHLMRRYHRDRTPEKNAKIHDISAVSWSGGDAYIWPLEYRMPFCSLAVGHLDLVMRARISSAQRPQLLNSVLREIPARFGELMASEIERVETCDIFQVSQTSSSDYSEAKFRLARSAALKFLHDLKLFAIDRERLDDLCSKLSAFLGS